MEKNDIYTIRIFDVSDAGDGIGRIDGMVTFVPGLLPGDEATVAITDVRKNLARAKAVTLDVPSPERTEPRCGYANSCGGCTLQRMKYDAQLRLKEKQLHDKLERIYGGAVPDMDPMEGMAEPWHFRNKTSYAVYAGKALVQKDGSIKNSERPRVGFYDGKARHIVEAVDCPVSAPAAVSAAGALRKYIKLTGISVYDEKSRKGRLRQLTVRCGFQSREVMVVITVNGKKIPKPELLAELMYDAIDSLNDETEENRYELRSLIVNYNSNRSLAEVSTKHDVIYGQPVIRDACAGLEFEISPFSFYQVNPLQMEKLYATVLEFADLKGNETVFDLYCGVGTIGLYCARRARQVWGIEAVKSAVIDANRNAVINGIVNIQFIHGKAEEKIFELLESKDSDMLPHVSPDVVIVDPPRAGCHPELLEAILRAAPERIIYVSCNPGTLARDLRILAVPGAGSAGRVPPPAPVPQAAAPAGAAAAVPDSAAPGSLRSPGAYTIKRIRGIDNFCHTTHVETVCSLVLRKPVTHINIDVDVEELVQEKRGQATYEQIKAWVLEHSGLKVTNLYIAQVKQKYGIIERENYNKPKYEDSKQPICPPEKEKAITEALKYFGMI